MSDVEALSVVHSRLGIAQVSGLLGLRAFDLSSVEGADAVEHEGCRLRSRALTSLKHGPSGAAPATPERYAAAVEHDSGDCLRE